MVLLQRAQSTRWLGFTLALATLIGLPSISVGQALDEEVAASIGAWQLDFVTSEGDRQTPFVLIGRQEGALAAWYFQPDEDTLQKFSSIRVDGDSLVLKIRPAEFEGLLSAKLVAWATGDGRCRGEIEYSHADGDEGSFDFTGIQFAEDKFDKVDHWNVSFTTPDGDRENAHIRILTVDGQQYGWYRSDDYDLPLRKVVGSDGKLSFSATAMHGGEEVVVSFAGDVDGVQVAGRVEFEIEGESGSIPFEGTRRR